jgi:hypothetical protein
MVSARPDPAAEQVFDALRNFPTWLRVDDLPASALDNELPRDGRLTRAGGRQPPRALRAAGPRLATRPAPAAVEPLPGGSTWRHPPPCSAGATPAAHWPRAKAWLKAAPAARPLAARWSPSDDAHDVHPIRWVPSLYFVQGLQFFVVMLMAGLMFKNMGVANDHIARWTGLLGLAWAFKPLWSPLLELAAQQEAVVVGLAVHRRAGLARWRWCCSCRPGSPPPSRCSGCWPPSRRPRTTSPATGSTSRARRQVRPPTPAGRAPSSTPASFLTLGGLLVLAGQLERPLRRVERLVDDLRPAGRAAGAAGAAYNAVGAAPPRAAPPPRTHFGGLWRHAARGARRLPRQARHRAGHRLHRAVPLRRGAGADHRPAVPDRATRRRADWA